MLRQRLLILATLAIVTPTLAEAQTTSNWLAPVDGLWGDPTNWSTDPIAPLTPGYEAVVDAAGAPYTATVAGGFAIDSVTVDSPDASVRIINGAHPNDVEMTGGIEVNQGELVLEFARLTNTRLSGAAGVWTDYQPERNFERVIELDNVTVATHLRAKPETSHHYLEVTNNLTLDGGRIDLGTRQAGDGRVWLLLQDDASLLGSGEIVTSRPVATPPYVSSFSPDAYLYVDGDSTTHDIAEGVTVRAERGAELKIDYFGSRSTIPRIKNYGVVEAVGGSVYMDLYVAFSNYGTLRAVDGGRLYMRFHSGPAGNLEIGPGSQVEFVGGNVSLNEPVTVPTDALLRLDNSWSSATTVTVDGGTVEIGRDASTIGDWVWNSGAVLKLTNSFDFDRILQYGTAADTKILLDRSGSGVTLGGVSRDLSDIPGVWDLNRATISDGTLTGLPGNAIAANTDTLTLDNVAIDFPLAVEAGSVDLRGTSTIGRPLTLSGGSLRLDDGWSNPAGVTVTGGTLQVVSLPATLGTIRAEGGVVSLPAVPNDPTEIDFAGGDLEVRFDTTLSELRAQPWTPANVYVDGGAAFDLEDQTVDVAGAPWGLGATGGEFHDGVIWKSTDDGPWQVAQVRLRDVTLQTDIDSTAGVYLQGDVTIEGSRLDGYVNANSANQLTLNSVTIDDRLDANNGYGDAEPIVATGGLTVNGEFELGVRTLRVEGGAQTIDGTGEINTYGIRGAPGGGIEAISGDLTLGPELTFRSARNGSFITVESGELINEGTIAADRDSYGQSLQDVSAPLITITAGNGFNRRAFRQNGALWIEEDYEVRVDARTLVNAGEIELRGGLLNTGPAGVQNEGEFRGDGAVVAFASPGFQNAGRILVGDHPIYNTNNALVSEETTGLLQIVGDYTESPGSELLIDLAGPDPGLGYDRLSVSGSVTIAGGLTVSLLDGYDPLAGQTFEILTAGGGLSGEFSQVTLPTLTGGRDWLVEYLATSVRLRVLGLPGDYNADGLVTQDDLAIYREEYGAVGVGLSADGNGDGRVDAADYTVWRDALASQPAAVPEPAGLAGLLLGLVAAGRWRRWRA